MYVCAVSTEGVLQYSGEFAVSVGNVLPTPRTRNKVLNKSKFEMYASE